MPMTVIVTRNVEDRYRGFLASCMLEIAPGVYTGPRMTSGVRERIWRVLSEWHGILRQGAIVMTWSEPAAPGGPRHTASWRTASQSARFRRDHARAPGARDPSLILPKLLKTLLQQPLACEGFPRPRGDGPTSRPSTEAEEEVPSPARGWSHEPSGLLPDAQGSPARAGMVPSPRTA